MNETLYFGGRQVGVGTVDPATNPYEEALAHERATAPATITGFFVGAIGGAVLGNIAHKGAVGAAVGTTAGGIGGALVGNAISSYVLRKEASKTAPSQKSCESLSEEERTVAFNKARANLEAAGTKFDASVWSDPTKFGAFMTEVYKAAGCSPP